MKCLRCEIARAKLRAILYVNMRWPVEKLVDDLNATFAAGYYRIRDANGATVYRDNDGLGPAIEIWHFKNYE